MRKWIPIVGLAVLLSACMSPVTPVHVQRYMLTQSPTVPAETPSNATLLISPITATTGFDTDAMLYSQGNYRLSAFAENTWVAPPAAMIAPLLMQTLQQSAYFKAVLLEPVTAKATYQLNVRLVSLYQDFNVNPSTVKLVVEVSLSTQNGRVLAGTRFNVAVPASANTPEAGVAATNAAVAQVLQDINGFVLQAVKLSSSS